jgi:hypothetical protein
MSPLKKLYDQIDEVNEKLRCKSQDFRFGCLGKAAQERAMDAIAQLKDEKELLENKLKYAELFYNGLISKTVTTSNKERYGYFGRNLPGHTWMLIPDRAPRCEICHRQESDRTGIVFTTDPFTKELVEICSNCYIEQTRRVDFDKAKSLMEN